MYWPNPQYGSSIFVQYELLHNNTDRAAIRAPAENTFSGWKIRFPLSKIKLCSPKKLNSASCFINLARVFQLGSNRVCTTFVWAFARILLFNICHLQKSRRVFTNIAVRAKTVVAAVATRFAFRLPAIDGDNYAAMFARLRTVSISRRWTTPRVPRESSARPRAPKCSASSFQSIMSPTNSGEKPETTPHTRV